MVKKLPKLEIFGQLLAELRQKQKIGLREICRKLSFDPSNWSKIERGILAPPNNAKVLGKWAITLGIKKNSAKYHEFVDSAFIAQNIIPEVLQETEIIKKLPAFLRTGRNKKPTKEDLDRLIELINN